jgi:hypothetical protein
MGMQQTVVLEGSEPKWSAVRDLLSAAGFPVQMRMIDGELSFPDEEPGETWRELRLGTPQGMVTVQRHANRLVLVTWGNADMALRQAWNAVTWAFSEVGRGRVETPQGPLTPAEYRQSAELPDALRRSSGSG